MAALPRAVGQTPSEYNEIGEDYYYGRNGKPQDYGEAVRWYRKAAAQGYASAQYNLGVSYANGQGVPQDYGEAVKWWRKVAAQGYAKAQAKLGLCYYNGQGVPRDYGEAVRWWRKACDQNYEDACKVLADLGER